MNYPTHSASEWSITTDPEMPDHVIVSPPAPAPATAIPATAIPATEFGVMMTVWKATADVGLGRRLTLTQAIEALRRQGITQ